MSSIEDGNFTDPLHKSDRTAPGWLFVLPWSLQLIAGGGVNEVLKALIREFRNDDVFTPHLLVSTEEPEAGPTAGLEVIKPFLLNLWSPVNREHPVRGLISFVFRLPYRYWALRRIIKHHKIKVINPHFPNLGCLVFTILKKLGLFDSEIILSFHNSDITNALQTSGLERRLWRVLLRRANRIVLVSNSLAPDLLSIEPRIAAKLTTIYNGVDVGLFSSRDHVERSLSRQVARPTVISVASFLPIKGHDGLVRAFSSVVKRIPDARLLLVGHDGPAYQEVRVLIDKLALGDHVFLHKDVSHELIPGYLAQAQLFVLASHREGHPFAVMEAGAAGLPVICTRAIGSMELISDRITGRIVEVGNEHALAEVMIELLTNLQEAKRMAVAFHEFIKNNLTWRRTYEQYLQLACGGVRSHTLVAQSTEE